jgi:diguanylate cyclase (GGDEF)-like protein
MDGMVGTVMPAATFDPAAMARSLLTELGAVLDSDRHVKLLERVLAAAAEAQQVVADQRQRIAELEALSVTDELTGLANRRGFTLALKHALSNMRRHGGEAALIVVDLDGFKDVNDTFGHAAGDHVLRLVAENLRAHVRDTDTVARLGGDEFAMLLPGATQELARFRATALTRLIDRTVARWQAARIPVAASFGLTMVDGSDGPDAAMERADQSMYRSKRERNAA